MPTDKVPMLLISGSPGVGSTPAGSSNGRDVTRVADEILETTGWPKHSSG